MIRAVTSVLGRFGYSVRRLDEDDRSDLWREQCRLLEGVQAPLIVDVGAHDGKTVAAYKARVPDARIHACEPLPEEFAVLRRRTVGLARVSLHNVALGPRPGRADLHVTERRSASSLLEVEDEGSQVWGDGVLGVRETVSVPVTTLDQLARQEGFSQIDLLKLDVQGAELQVMDGACELVRGRAIRAVLAEVITRPTYRGQPRLHEFFAYFDRAGFQLRNLFGFSYSDGWLRQMDALFVRRASA